MTPLFSSRDLRSFSPARRRRRPARRLRLGLTVSATLLCAGAAHLRAQSANSNDSLIWDGGASETSWTSANNVWYDATQSKAVSLGDNAIDQGQTYRYTFNGAGTNRTVAPTAMTIGDDSSATLPVLGVNALTFNDGFAQGNTMTVSSGHDNGPAEALNFANGWTLTDNSTSGVVTFNTPAASYTSVLYLTLGGSGTVSVNSGASVVLNTAVSDNSGNYSITKTGGGALTLSPFSSLGNKYTGGTTVTGGTLVVSGPNSPTGTGMVTVSNTGSVLAGSGTIQGSTTINSGAAISPGLGSHTVGILKIGTGATSMLTLDGDYDVDIVGGGTTPGVNNDELDVTGTVTLNAISSHLVLGSVNPAGLVVGQTFDIIASSGLVLGEFDGLLPGATVTDPAGDTYTIGYSATDVTLTVASVVPEPSAVVGCLCGAAGIAGGIRGRKRHA